jgi:ADP-heptose:LPS heptosyltransferase
MPRSLPDNSSLLVVLTGSLGDVARGTSLLPGLRERFPQGKIYWLIDSRWEQFISSHALIDEVIVFDRKRGIRGVLDLRKKLKARTFDLTLDLQRHFKSGVFSFLSGAKKRIGFHPKNAKEFNWIFNNFHIEERDDSLTKILHYQLFLEMLGATTPEKLTFGSFNLPEQSFVSGDGVGVLLGSSWESKDWMPQGYSQLVEELLEQTHLTVVLLGDQSKIPLAEKLMATDFVRAQSARVVNTVGKTSLLEMISVVRDLRLCVGPDSGPGHIASLFETPYITLFGPTAPERVAPYGSEGLSITSSIGCSPCGKRKCPGLNQLCMRLIPASTVMTRVHEVLAK